MDKLLYHNLFSRLKYVTRFSGDNFIQPEKLESHIIEMVGLAFDLHFNVGGFDINKLLYLILIHDLDESVTVDIPRPFKYSSDEFRVALNKAVSNYMVNLGLDNKFLLDCLNAKSLGIEGKVLELIDLYQVYLKVKLEESLGNTNLKEHHNNVVDSLTKLGKESDIINYYNYLTNYGSY
jgi:5'-deoxynucleotidase YfbR-like HD superfamily hydrolase